MAWLLDARRDYLRNSLFLPPSMERLRDEFCDNQDKLMLFVKERCSLGPGLLAKRDIFYHAYRGWCIDAGLQPESKPELYRKLEQHAGLKKLGVELDRKRLVPGRSHDRQRVVTGLELRPFDDEDV
jgi:phage/plasmid-associated DNA primase